MRNGEMIGEELSSVVVSANDPPGDDAKSDSGDALSEYSSCGGGGFGGESEFERYCSANSAIGTPSSVCSSLGSVFHEIPDNFKLGGDFSSKRSSECTTARLSDFYTPTSSGYKGSILYDQVGEFGNSCSLAMNGDVTLRDSLDYSVNRSRNQSGIDVSSRENVGADRNADTAGPTGNILDHGFPGDLHRIGFDEDCLCKNTNELEDPSEEGVSSRYEHSEGEDSMFGCGTDEEKRVDSYYWGAADNCQEGHGGVENGLIMNSSVAFGGDDWNDFVHEAMENQLDFAPKNVFASEKRQQIEDGMGSLNPAGGTEIGLPNVSLACLAEEVKDIHVASDHAEQSNYEMEKLTSLAEPCHDARIDEDGCAINEKDLLISNDEVRDVAELTEYLERVTVSNMFRTKQDLLPDKPLFKKQTTVTDQGPDGHQNAAMNEVIVINADPLSQVNEMRGIKLIDNPLSGPSDQHPATPMDFTAHPVANFSTDLQPESLYVDDTKTTAKVIGESSPSLCYFENHFAPLKVGKHELNEYYDDFVHDMEEILFESGEPPGSRFQKNTQIYHSEIPLPSRDGSSSASTSGIDDTFPLNQQHLRIDTVEVTGARQKKGDVSFSELLVGVREYTLYRIRVWCEGDNWEVERRYRDFCALHRRLKKLYADEGWILPPLWSSVDQESRKYFGSVSPNVIAERSTLIQECLQSVLHSRSSSAPADALMSFLLPSETELNFSSGPRISQLGFHSRGPNSDKIPTLGKTISLVVHIWPVRSTKRILDAQHYRCADCHKRFDDGNTRMQEFVKSLGWGKPRLCEYSGQLYCSSCHINDSAVLPARVLHHWDFNQYPVSQLAKSYLDSIHDQPMLCVSAINPFLLSKVPTLQHVTNIRKRIRAMLPYVRCPYRMTIFRGLGTRRYLLESSEFFSLRDLMDLSKGIFAALPTVMETVSRKILEHITEQCLVCCDAGVPCNARQACDDNSSLIFPFQEVKVEKCRTCNSVFHQACFKKIISCPCGAVLNPDEQKGRSTTGSSSSISLWGNKADTGGGFFSDLILKVAPQRSRDAEEQRPKNDTIILMSSLENTSL